MSHTLYAYVEFKYTTYSIVNNYWIGSKPLEYRQPIALKLCKIYLPKAGRLSMILQIVYKIV